MGAAGERPGLQPPSLAALSLRVSYLTSICPHFLIDIIALIAGPVPRHCSES